MVITFRVLLATVTSVFMANWASAQTVSATVPQTGTNSTSAYATPTPAFGNSVEPGGMWHIAVANGGAAT